MKAFTTMNTSAYTDTSSAILDEFFGGGGEFQQVRKKALRRAGRSPVKKASLKSLHASSNEQLLDGGESTCSFVSKKASAQGQNKIEAKRERRPLPKKTQKSLKDLHIEDNNVVSDLIHRVTHLSGLEPGAQRVLTTPADMMERAGDMKDLQFKDLMDPSEHFKDTLAVIVQVHKDIGELAQNVFYFRQSLGRDLKQLNGFFMKHFQLLISEILSMHRIKFKSQTDTVNALLHRLDVLEKEAVEISERCEVLKISNTSLEAENERMAALCQNKDIMIKMLQDELSAQERSQKELVGMMERQRMEEEAERKKRQEQDKHMLLQEKKLLLKQRQDLQAELMRQNALIQESHLLQDRKSNSSKKEGEAIFQAVNKKSESCTQTEYDDFGTWDRQSGWTLPISGTAKARNRWRQSQRYASCPSCRGVGKFMSAAAAQYKFFLRGEVITDETYDLKKWRIPDQIVRFMSNIPRSIQAEQVHDLKWVIRHVWNFFDFKVKTDADDIRLGQPLQMFSDFIIDSMLQRCEKRIDAEMYLYRLLKSVQSCLAKKKTPVIHSFARFLGVFGTNDEEDESETVESVTEASAPREKESGVERKNQKNVQSEKKFVNRGSKATVDNTHMKAPNSNLSRGILDVYLFSRSCMLKPYNGIYAAGIKQAKQASGENCSVMKSQRRLEGSDEDRSKGWGLAIPPHVVISDSLAPWVPLDRALEVSTAVLGFLSEKQMLALNRQIEHETLFLTKHGNLEEPEGSHSVIRAAVRKQLKAITGEGHLADEGTILDGTIIMVNLEKVLQATIQQLSSRMNFVETRLKKLFVNGDDNGDGELSFREFNSIVGQVAPHFSGRTQLQMFREALMSGNDNSAITEQGFVTVCRKYGLVQLVDIQHLQHNVLALSDNGVSLSNMKNHDVADGKILKARSVDQARQGSLDKLGDEGRVILKARSVDQAGRGSHTHAHVKTSRPIRRGRESSDSMPLQNQFPPPPGTILKSDGDESSSVSYSLSSDLDDIEEEEEDIKDAQAYIMMKIEQEKQEKVLLQSQLEKMDPGSGDDKADLMGIREEASTLETAPPARNDLEIPESQIPRYPVRFDDSDDDDE